MAVGSVEFRAQAVVPVLEREVLAGRLSGFHGFKSSLGL